MDYKSRQVDSLGKAKNSLLAFSVLWDKENIHTGIPGQKIGVTESLGSFFVYASVRIRSSFSLIVGGL